VGSRFSRFHDADDRSIDLVLALDSNVGVCLILFLFLMIVANTTSIFTLCHAEGRKREKKEKKRKKKKRRRRRPNRFFDLDLVDLETIEFGRKLFVEGKLVLFIHLTSERILGDHSHLSTCKGLKSAFQFLLFDVCGLFDLLIAQNGFRVEEEQNHGLEKRNRELKCSLFVVFIFSSLFTFFKHQM